MTNTGTIDNATSDDGIRLKCWSFVSQVSWVRSSDLQILTHAGYVFTADTRVSCEEAPAGPEADEPSDGSGEPTSDRAPRVVSHDGGWHGSAVHTLRIRRLRVGDAGRYECQVNTEPKMSLFFNLTVIGELHRACS